MKGIEFNIGSVYCKQTYNLVVCFHNPWTVPLFEIEQREWNDHLTPRVFPRGLEIDTISDYYETYMTFKSEVPFSPKMAERMCKHIADLEIAYEYFKRTSSIMEGEPIDYTITEAEVAERYHTWHSVQIDFKYPHIQMLIRQDGELPRDAPGKITPNEWDLDHVASAHAVFKMEDQPDEKTIKIVINRIVELERAFDHMTKE